MLCSGLAVAADLLWQRACCAAEMAAIANAAAATLLLLPRRAAMLPCAAPMVSAAAVAALCHLLCCCISSAAAAVADPLPSPVTSLRAPAASPLQLLLWQILCHLLFCHLLCALAAAAAAAARAAVATLRPLQQPLEQLRHLLERHVVPCTGLLKRRCRCLRRLRGILSILHRLDGPVARLFPTPGWAEAGWAEDRPLRRRGQRAPGALRSLLVDLLLQALAAPDRRC